MHYNFFPSASSHLNVLYTILNLFNLTGLLLRPYHLGKVPVLPLCRHWGVREGHVPHSCTTRACTLFSQLTPHFLCPLFAISPCFFNSSTYFPSLLLASSSRIFLCKRRAFPFLLFFLLFISTSFASSGATSSRKQRAITKPHFLSLV